MLGSVVCWAIGLGMLFSRVEGLVFEFTTDYTRMLYAMGFIFLGILSRAVSVYRETHVIELDVTEDENGKLVLNKK